MGDLNGIRQDDTAITTKMEAPAGRVQEGEWNLKIKNHIILCSLVRIFRVSFRSYYYNNNSNSTRSIYTTDFHLASYLQPMTTLIPWVTVPSTGSLGILWRDHCHMENLCILGSVVAYFWSLIR